jgi:2-polyprenyl-6-methoxyphenol hydroxylase-like FAD-dependent oxidoreductase
MPDVIIIGAGPAGLTLGAELAARGVKCIILEKRAQRSVQSRAFSVTPHTLELLDMRGHADIFLAQGFPCEFAPLGDGKSKLSFQQIKSRFTYLLSIPQEKTETILENWALQSGVKIIRGAELIDLKQDTTKVTITYKENDQEVSLTAAYAIGCDGVNSKVRELAKIPTTKIKYEKSLMHGDVKLNKPPVERVFAKTSFRGMVAVIPLLDDIYRVLALDQEKMHVPIEEAITLDEFTSSVTALANKDFEISSALWLSRFRCQQNHAHYYRDQRILLAGDAAHTHLPAGGQGLQISIQDGFNLGWKLAAVIKNGAQECLLDTYESERRPLIDKAMRRSIIMFRYEIAQDKLSRLLKWLANKLVLVPFLQNFILNELAGLSIEYQALKIKKFANHLPLAGKKINNLTIHHAVDNTKKLFQVMRDNKFLLLVDAFDQGIQDYIQAHWDKKITYATSYELKNAYGIKACLVRPDGFISWSSKQINFDQLAPILENWVY